MQFNLSNNEEFIVQRGEEVVNIFDIEGGGGGDSTGKTDVTAFTAHTADTSVHVSTSEKNTWNGKQDALSNASVLSGISASDITNWNSKTSNVGTITGINMNGASKGTSGVVNLGTVITAETDPTVPAWAKESTKPSYTASEVGALPDSTVIPTALSALTDDATHRLVTDTEKSTWNAAEANVQSDWSQTGTTADDYIKNKPNIPDESTVSGWGFTKNAGTITGINMNGASKGTSGVVNLGTVITAETDPTVPAWAKESTKPSYTASEVGALPDSTVIPTALSALTDDATHRLVTDTEKSAWNAAEANVQSDWNQTGTTADDYIKNKPNIPDESTVSGWGFTKNAGTITGINMNGASKGTSGIVNLGTVITAETDPTVPAWAKETTKPSYTASEVGALPDTTVIPTTVASLTDSGNYTLTSTTNALSGTVTGHTADTAIHVTSNDKTAWNGKADNTAFTAHTASTSVHVSTSEKNTWNGKASASDLSTLSGTVTAHTADTTVHVTSGDKTSWNGKTDNTAFTAHTASTSVHVSTAEKNTWNGKADNTAFTAHTASTTAHVTTAEKNTWNGKADNTAFTAHTASTSVHLPAVSSSDNGKVMMVSGGTWVLATPVSIYSGSDAPNNANGNNGDLYFQTL